MRLLFYSLVILVISSCNFKSDEDQRLAYVPFSNSVIEIEFLNESIDSLKLVTRAATNIPSGMSMSNILDIYKKGTYYLRIEIDRPTKYQTFIGKEMYNIMVFPNDTTHIEVALSGNDLMLSFSGRSEAINKYYLRKKETLGFADNMKPFNQFISSASSYNSIKNGIDSITNQEVLFLGKYTTSNTLPAWFLNYENAEILYSGAGLKTQIPGYNDTFKMFKDEIPHDYFNYLKELNINNERAIFSGSYFYFLDQYFLRSLPSSEYGQLSGRSLSNKLSSHTLSQSRTELSGSTKEIYHKKRFSQVVKFYSDSLQIDSLAQQFEIESYDDLLKDSGSRLENKGKGLNLKKGDKIPEFFVIDNQDSLVSIREFEDNILYINFWATWCSPCIKNIPELNTLISTHDDNSQIKFLNICLNSKMDQWISTIEKHDLGGINLIAQGNWNAKLRSYFNIGGIPQYVLVSKDNILFENFTDKAPMVQEQIKKMLNDTTTQQ